MRLPLIPPASLTPEQKPLYDDMKRGIETSFKGFKAMADDGTTTASTPLHCRREKRRASPRSQLAGRKGT